MNGTLRLAEYLGSETMFYMNLEDGTEFSVKADGLAKAETGKTISLGVPAAACHLFDGQGKSIHSGDLSTH
jgi:multiple sugar transport system ATP-binding protein